jgi:hypothetical protein
VFVGLFDDTTTTTLTNGAIREQLYGADANFRMNASHFANLSNFDVMVGLRYVGLDEKLTASVNSVFSRLSNRHSACRRRSISAIPCQVPTRSGFAITSSGHRLVSTPNSIGTFLGRE